MNCSKCGYSWEYKGALQYATCPSCQSKTMVRKTYLIQFIHEWDHAQYYQGHSDIFDEELLGCIPLAVPFNWYLNDEGLRGLVHESLGELKDRVMHELNAYDFSELPEGANMIPDHEFRHAINETLGDPKYDNMSLATVLGLETNPEASYDEFMHYCYFHLYEEA